MQKKALFFLLFLSWALPLSANMIEKPFLQYGVFDVYQQNRQQGIPNYITVDLWLSAYSLLRQTLWQEREQKELEPGLRALTQALLKASASQPEDEAGLANRDFAALLTRLLNPNNDKPLSKRVQSEWDLINRAQGISNSPIWGYPVDYSQFKPRGRYTQNEAMHGYFMAYRYAATIAFYINPSDETGIDEVLADRLLTQTRYWLKSAQQIPELRQALKPFNDGLSWALGTADDLTLTELESSKLDYQTASLAELRQGINRYAEQNRRQPQLVGALASLSKEGTVDNASLLAWRMLPARLNAESVALQTLLFPNTGDYSGEESQRAPFGLLALNGRKIKAFPSSYELAMIQLGKDGDYWLNFWQENQFENYAKARQQAERVLAQAQGLDAEQLKLFQAILQEPDGNQLRLPTAMAFWTWQRYLQLLYQKPAYTLISKGIGGDKPRPGAQLEQAPEIYHQLLSLADAHYQQSQEPRWKQFAELLQKTLEINDSNVNQPEHQQFLNTLDSRLQQITGQTDTPIVVDIHNEPNSQQVVEEGVGYSDPVVLEKARGARLTHYEFKRPFSERMDDSAWQEELKRSFGMRQHKTHSLPVNQGDIR